MPKRVRVRIAVAVGDNGEWNAIGFNLVEHDDAELAGCALDPLDAAEVVVHWVEAWLPVPEGVTVEGETP